MAWREEADFGHVTLEKPFRPAVYTKATAPDAAAYANHVIIISDGGAGDIPVLAFSNGTNWDMPGTTVTKIATTVNP